MAKSGMSEAAAIMGRSGGKARARSLSPQRRKQIAQHAAMTRWIKTRQDHQNMIARLTITLDGPTIVRRQIEVPLTIKLDQLHRVFQAVMGWAEVHLFCFWTKRPYERGFVRYLSDDDEPWDDDPDARLAKDTTFAEFIGQISKKTFIYTYDFGDDWHHDVRIDMVTERDAQVSYPRLLLAEGRCPPEDVGGPWGYHDYLARITNPDHPKHAQAVEWSTLCGIDLPFDSSAVDEAQITKRLQEFWFLNATVSGAEAHS